MSGLEGALGIGSALAGGMLVQDAYEDLGTIGQDAQRYADQIAQQGLENTAFNPYSVQTATGGRFGVDASGNVSMGLSPQEQAIQNAAFGASQGMLSAAAGDQSQREQDVYDRIRALQLEDENQKALELENRLFAQGRLGASSDLYGGATPEMLAMQRANATARNQAALEAIGQAQSEQMQNADLASLFQGMGYIPQANLLETGQAGFNNAQLFQQGQIAGADLYGNARMSGIEAMLGAGQGQANLAGNVGASMLAGSLSNAAGEDGWLKALGEIFS